MHKPFVTISTGSVQTIIFGARLLAASDKQSADVMETIILKAVRIARQATVDQCSEFVANDKGTR